MSTVKLNSSTSTFYIKSLLFHINHQLTENKSTQNNVGSAKNFSTSHRQAKKPQPLREEGQTYCWIFYLSCYRLCLRSSLFFEKKTYSAVCKNAKLRLLTRNPFLTLHCYKLEMEAWLDSGSADAHFIEGVKQ